MAAPPRINVGDLHGVRVVRFVDRLIMDDSAVREVCDQLMALLNSLKPPINLILDFSSVQIVSSAMIAKLVLIQRKVDLSGGKMRICGLSEAFQGVLRTTNLDRIFSIDRDRLEARDAFDIPKS